MFKKSVSKGFAIATARSQIFACHGGNIIEYAYDRGFGLIEMVHKPEPKLNGDFQIESFDLACAAAFQAHPSLLNHDCPSLQVASEIELVLANKIILLYLELIQRSEAQALEANRNKLEKSFKIET